MSDSESDRSELSISSSEERHLDHVKKGDHREYASARAAAKKAEAKALRNEDTDADESAMSEAETRAEETKRERDETEPEPDTEAEAGGDEDDEGGDAKDDEDDEGEVSGSDKFSDRPATSPDRPDGVPKLKIDKKKKGAKDAGKKDAGKKKKKKKSDSDASDASEADSDAPRKKKAPDLRPPGRKRGETMRKLHKGATRSARGYRSSDGSDVSDGLDRNSENDSEYGGYTERSQFDGKTEYNKLTAAAVNYGKDTSLGKDGMAHKHEDLPIKMAFEHLSSLAGMSAKVQDAIAKSRNLFQRRMQRMDRGVLHKAWRGWLMVQLGFQKKKNVLQRAVRKMKRRKTYNAFHAWWELQNKSKKVGAMGQTARQVVVNGMRRRVFQAWRAKTADKRRQTIMAGHTSSLRDEFSERLVEVGLRQLVHKQMRKAWTGFASYANTCRVARNRARQAITRAQRGCAQRAFSEWQTQTEMAHMQRALCKRAQQRMSLGKVNRAFTEWHKAVAFKNTRVRKILTSQKRRAFAKWNANIHLKHKVARMRVLWGQRNKQAALQGWLSLWSLKQNQIAACEQIHKRTLGRGLRNAWKVWCGVVEEATGCSMEHVRALKDQNARLRRDNERFVRLVDSGEWGRGRVEELTEAGRVLRDERLQLSELIKNIKSEKEGFVKDAMAQAQESRGLKDRLVSGNFVQRNKMTIRGGSSFNTIQRVLKQDFLETGAADRNPNALRAYKVDRLALSKVSVFSDGEINVQASRRAGAGSQPFARGQRLGPSQAQPEARGGGGRPTPPAIGGAPPVLRQRQRAAGATGDDASNDGAVAPDGQSMLADALSSLSPEEVDALEDILKRGRAEKENETALAGGR